MNLIDKKHSTGVLIYDFPYFLLEAMEFYIKFF